MRRHEGEVYFGTILLERNRWAAGKEPSYLVSEWIERLKQDGFDGLELWENHAALCGGAELERLASSTMPVSVYNSYVSFEDGAEEERRQAAQLIAKLGAQAVKFNFGREQGMLDTYIRNWNEWVRLLPEPCRLLCECHPNTVMEEPRAAAAAIKDMDRCEAIIHPFHCLGPLEHWFEHLGPAITHAHVQYRYGGQTFRRLSSNPEEIAGKLELMKKAGFQGSYTLEFVEGTGPGEEREKLYQAALDDLHTLKSWISAC